jgi:hypothetical protein
MSSGYHLAGLLCLIQFLLLFDILNSEPALGRSQALRRALLAFLSDARDPRNASPAFWGPFSVIGEGAAR